MFLQELILGQWAWWGDVCLLFWDFPWVWLLILFLSFHSFDFYSQGFKTLVVLTYLLLVSKVEKLKRFASLKTNMVLSSEFRQPVNNSQEFLKVRSFSPLKINSPHLALSLIFGVSPVIELLFWIVAFFMTIVGIGKSRNNLAYGLAAVVIISDFILVWVQNFFPLNLSERRRRRRLSWLTNSPTINLNPNRSLLAIPVALISIRHFRYLRQTGSRPEDEKESNSSEFHRLTTQRSPPFWHLAFFL